MTRAALIAAVVLAALDVGPAAAQGRGGVVTGVVTAAGMRAGGAVIYLVRADGVADTPPRDSTDMDQLYLRFEPAVLAVGPGAAVAFRNSDGVLHNVFSPERIGAGFDLGTYRRGERRVHVFAETGGYVILCHVHPEMAAFVVVVPSRWRAVVGPAGQFTIAGVPEGRYVLRSWHRLLRDPALPIAVAPGDTTRVSLLLERARRPRRPALEDGGGP